MITMRKIAIQAFAVALGVGLTIPSGAANLLTNGDFEGPWTGFFGNVYTIGSQIGQPVDGCFAIGWLPWSSRMPDTVNSNPYDPQFRDNNLDCASVEPNRYALLINGYGPAVSARGGLVQAVVTVPGTEYDLDFQAKTYIAKVDTELAYVGYDTTGQMTDPLSSTIEWTPAGFIPPHDTWSQYSLRFTAAANANGNKTSVWLRVIMPDGGQAATRFDNVVLDVAAQPKIDFPENVEPLATRISDTSYEITWDTNISSDSTVQYAPNKPEMDDGVYVPQEPYYGQSITQPGLGVQHSVLLAGLTPNTQYHYRVISKAAGSKSLVSKDYTFWTPASTNQTFINGSFETTDPASPPANPNQTAEGWVSFTLDPLVVGVGGFEDPDGIVTGYPMNGFANWHGAAKAQHGNNFIAAVSSYDKKNGGFYQRVSAVPGNTYDLSGYIGGYNAGGAPTDTRVWIGIDPNGGVDALAPSIAWSDEAQRIGIGPATSAAKWVYATASTTATANVVTVFVRFEQKYGLVTSATVADNLTLTGPPASYVDVDSVGAAKAESDGAGVNFTEGMIVTLVPTDEPGFFYMQDAQGNAGIRVETIQSLPLQGDKVKVKGQIGTNPNGERVIHDAILTPDGTGTTPIRKMNNKAVGGAGYIDANLGLSTQGLLVKVTGKITDYGAVDGVVFLIDDGSNMNPLDLDGKLGLKVIKSDYYGADLDVNDDFLSVIGVITSEKVNGQNIRVIRCRSSADVTLLNPTP